MAMISRISAQKKDKKKKNWAALLFFLRAGLVVVGCLEAEKVAMVVDVEVVELIFQKK